MITIDNRSSKVDDHWWMMMIDNELLSMINEKVDDINDQIVFSCFLDGTSSEIFGFLRGNSRRPGPSHTQLFTFLIREARGQCVAHEIFTAAGTGRSKLTVFLTLCQI